MSLQNFSQEKYVSAAQWLVFGDIRYISNRAGIWILTLLPVMLSSQSLTRWTRDESKDASY